ncbi:MAG: class I SAM-dependent methyltransferase [Chloroflexi bacterium]|nr:MAG: class I SAM-dependent methyltransferase [Chloroflexota bacterium]
MSWGSDLPLYALQARLLELFRADRAEEIGFWAWLAGDYGLRVVDWAAGAGEIACGLAAQGFRVTGVERRPEWLALAEERAEALPSEVRPRWVEGEVTTTRLRDRFDFALLTDDAFGRLPDAEARRQALRTIFLHLRPGGGMALVLTPPPLLPVDEGLRPVPRLRPLPDGVQVERFRRYRYEEDIRRLFVEEVLEVREGGHTRRVRWRYEVQLFTPDAIFRLLRIVGFTAIGLFGGWDRRPWRPGSPAWIVRAERPL